MPGFDFFTPEKKTRANIRYWEAKVLLRRRGAQDQGKRAVLGLPVIGGFWDSESRRDELREECVRCLRTEFQDP